MMSGDELFMWRNEWQRKGTLEETSVTHPAVHTAISSSAAG